MIDHDAERQRIINELFALHETWRTRENLNKYGNTHKQHQMRTELWRILHGGTAPAPAKAPRGWRAHEC